MIILFSFHGDRITNKLIDWLLYYNIQFKRINLEDETPFNITIEYNNDMNIKFKLINSEIINFSEVKYFYVRGVGFKELNCFTKIPNIPQPIINKYLKLEWETLINFFYSEINKKSIGSFKIGDNHSKLKQYKIVKSLGLNLPKSIICNNLEEINSFHENKNLITKAIQDNIATEYNRKVYLQRVQRFNIKEIDKEFFPSFFQIEIEKQYEIRTFIFDQKCYSIKFTFKEKGIDMRDYYNQHEYASYQLPKNIQNKLISLIEKLELKSGSIDLIKDMNNNYYYLETNPNGQYDWVSTFTETNLHQTIAIFFKNEIKKLK